MTKAEGRPRLKILLGSSTAIGPGKAELLAAVAECGSIAAAARRMGMSYRRAWLLVTTMNACFRGPLFETTKGGAARGGARLTPLGAEVLGRYRRMEARARRALASEMREFGRLLVGRPPED